jgi:hypothetical protein
MIYLHKIHKNYFILYREDLDLNKNIDVYKISNINPLIEKQNNIYSIIDLC